MAVEVIKVSEAAIEFELDQNARVFLLLSHRLSCIASQRIICVINAVVQLYRMTDGATCGSMKSSDDSRLVT